MHIVMLSDQESLGGAAVAASRLATELCRNHRVTRLVLFPDGRPHPWRTWVLGQENAFARFARRVARKLVLPNLPRPGTPDFVASRLRRALNQLRPDLIHLHNLHGGAPWGWTPQLAEVCADVAPVVWTLHDMWSFTGRCAYAYDCQKFAGGCDATCPTADEAPRLTPDLIHPSWDQRRQIFRRHPQLVAVTPSRWLARQALAGLWADHHLITIPNGVPLDVYRPLHRLEARQTLGLPSLGPVVLVVAQDLTERRKGATLFPDLWRFVDQPQSLLTMGQGKVPGLAAHALGFVADEKHKVLAYNAADVLLHPAPVDNFPNVVLEAMACGTPAVGLPVGGVPEMILPGATGWLASEATSAALGHALTRALGDIQANRDLRASCRSRAEKEFSSKMQADRYEILYRETVETFRGCFKTGTGPLNSKVLSPF